MEGFTYTDIFATKGTEYLMVIFFLMTFMVFWKLLSRPARAVYQYTAERLIPAIRGWFAVPEGFYYHPGHTWAKVEATDLVTVGIDDFAQKLVGKIERISLPQIGTSIAQGDTAVELHIDDKTIPMLAPVEGKVVAVNKDVLRMPEAINGDAYGRGWLMKIHSPRMKTNLKNLLSGTLAHRWIEETQQRLSSQISDPAVGATMADGGMPVTGIAKNAAPDTWDQMAKEFFLTTES